MKLSSQMSKSKCRLRLKKGKFCYITMLISYRLHQLKQQFKQLLSTEVTWSIHLFLTKNLYVRFFDVIEQQIHNIICASCECIDHRLNSYEHVFINYDSLHLFAVSVNVNIFFDFSCDINLLNERRVLLDKDEITFNRQNVIFCKFCYFDLQYNHHSVQSLFNF